MTKTAVLAMLDELIALTILDEENVQSFKVRAYEKARRGVENATDDLPALSDTQLTKIDGVGKSTAAKIREYLTIGSVEKIDQLRKKYPPEFVALSNIPGLGPKSIKTLRAKLSINNLADLQTAIDSQQLRELEGFGATSEEKIAKAIERLGISDKNRRFPIADALPLAQALVDRWIEVESVSDATFCGSLRRMNETVADIDITIGASNGPLVAEKVRSSPEITEMLAAGDTKISFLVASGLQVDVRIVSPEQFGAATLYFTGSKAHTIAIRQLALQQNMLLNEYGLFKKTDDGKENILVASQTEQAIYAALGCDYVAPELREASGELEAAAKQALPDFIALTDMKGDLHYHTDRSGDGRSSVEEMVAAAAAKGYSYLAITDHGEDLAINGSNREQMLEHRDKIAALQPSYPNMTLLFGCELNIGPDGGLDYDSDFRALFDYTVASVHSHFDQSVDKQTQRLYNAIADPSVHSIGHLTGRYIGKRPGIELDMQTVFDALVEHDVALEINGSLNRLDAASDVVRQATERGVKLVINTDSHHKSELGRMEYGVLTARRGWATKDLVVNSWPRDKFLTWIGYN